MTFADVEPCLVKRDLQLHFKRLRKRLESKSVKYYAVGEYGDIGNRPHYHYLFFYRGKCDRFTIQNLIHDSWPCGFSQVLPVNGAQGYVTKYILKFDKREHLVKPFSLISHGLGLDYLSPRVVDYHRKNMLNYCLKPGGFKVKMPRYYQDKVFSTYQRLVMKKRADAHRLEIDRKLLDKVDLMVEKGVNYFRNKDENYKMRLFNSIKIYRQKKKL